MTGSKRPTRVGEVLATYLERAGLAEKVEAAAVVPDWAPRVGDRIAEVTRPLHVAGDTLVVAVRSSAWMMELKMMESQILRRLNAGRKRGRIEHLRFVLEPD
ncbi:MAG: DUF721 domain-containing protein [Gemmatimonadota bacterium]